MSGHKYTWYVIVVLQSVGQTAVATDELPKTGLLLTRRLTKALAERDERGKKNINLVMTKLKNWYVFTSPLSWSDETVNEEFGSKHKKEENVQEHHRLN